MKFIPERGRKLGRKVDDFMIRRVEIYPREGTEMRLAGGQVPLYQLLKFIPVRGRKRSDSARMRASIPVEIYPREGTET